MGNAWVIVSVLSTGRVTCLGQEVTFHFGGASVRCIVSIGRELRNGEVLGRYEY